MAVERTMPARQRIMTMKLFGTALLSLAFFSFCSGDGEGTSGNNTISPEPATSVSSPRPKVAENNTNPEVNITTNTPTSPANTTTTPPTTQNTSNTAGWSASSTQNTTAKTEHNFIQTTAVTDNAANTGQGEKVDSSYKDIILPVIITLIVISLVVFLLMALYKICLKTTPERQENGTEQAPSDKENVKLISVKTTSPETGEQASQGKNKTRQHNDSSSHLSNKCV